MRTYLRALVMVTGMGLMACDGSGTDPVTDAALFRLSETLDLDLSNPMNYSDPSYPDHYSGRTLDDDNAPPSNPVTDEGATLGRVLFFDKALSVNWTISCSSCHEQSLGFTDSKRFSIGFEGDETGKHSMRLANANFFTGEHMFWDRRAENLEDQALQPVMDGVEMGFDADAGGLDELVSRLEGTGYYRILFEWAFGSAGISVTRMRNALAQYVRSIVSTGSRFDEGLEEIGGGPGPGPGAGQGGGRGEGRGGGRGGRPGTIGDLPTLSQVENLGLRLFTERSPRGAGCAGCHEIPTFALDANEGSNGLDAGQTVVFKSPSLKNVAITGPYMHDGRFATLLEVVEHYNSGVQGGPALDRRLRGRGGQPGRLNLTEVEKNAMVAFLGTLTDFDLLADPRFSDPFIH